MVDCSPLHQGGGVQVALGFLHFAKDDRAFEIMVVLPSTLLPVFRSVLGNDIKIIVIEKRGFLQKIKLSRELKSIDKCFRSDVVFTVFGPSYFTARSFHIIGFALGLLIYPPIRKGQKRKVFDVIMDKIKLYSFFRADRLVVETETVADRLNVALKNKCAPITVIKNSYSPQFYDEYINNIVLRRSNPILYQIFVPSSWYDHKNLLSIPGLAAEIKRRIGDSEFRFIFTLSTQSCEWQEIQKRSSELGIADKLVAIGNLDLTALAIAYSKSDIVYLPTLCESSTAVYPESFLAQKPLVTTDLDFARELCGDAALYVDPADYVETASRIVGLLASEAQQRRLVALGSAQLKRMYPSPVEKYRNQKKLIADCYSLQR